MAADRRAALTKRLTRPLGLGIIAATDNPATATYLAKKRQAAEAVGYGVTIKQLGPQATTAELLATCAEFNRNPQITGYIVQLPLPDQVDFREIFAAVDPAKDADGLTPTNLGHLFSKQERILPATAQGVLTLLEAYDVPITGQNVTVIGKGLLTGLPIATLLSHRGATVTGCDSKTKDIVQHTRQADLLIVAVGSPGLVTGETVKPGVVVIDVGVTKQEARIRGDVDFDSVAPKAAAITPVPGGVGPMTVVSLLENVYRLSKSPKD